MPEELEYDPLKDLEWFTSDDIDSSLFDNRWEQMSAGDSPATIQKARDRLEEIVASLEGLSKPGARKVLSWIEKHRDLWAWMVDWWYSRDAVLRIPNLISRFHKLAPTIVRSSPNQEVNAYLRESTRCYLYGFFQASVVLARAALEAALNDTLKRKLHSVPHLDLHEKITWAIRLKLVSANLGIAAKNVRDSANGVLHDGPVSERVAFDRLKDVRSVLLNLYER